jgi:hypothetical protein
MFQQYAYKGTEPVECTIKNDFNLRRNLKTLRGLDHSCTIIISKIRDDGYVELHIYGATKEQVDERMKSVL